MLLACVQLDGVGAIVKGNHPLVADRTLKFTGNLGVHDCRAALLFSGGNRSFELVELIVVQPDALTGRAAVHFHDILLLGGHLGGVAGTVHGYSVEGRGAWVKVSEV